MVSGAADLTNLVFDGQKGFKHDIWATLQLVSLIFRVALTWAAIICSFTSSSASVESGTWEETQALLDPENLGNPAHYSATQSIASADATEVDDDDGLSDADSDEDEKEIKELQQKRLREQGGWIGYLGGFLTFLPHLLPYKDRFTQKWLLLMVACVSTERVLTLMIPRQLGAITDVLGGGDGTFLADRLRYTVADVVFRSLALDRVTHLGAPPIPAVHGLEHGQMSRADPDISVRLHSTEGSRLFARHEPFYGLPLYEEFREVDKSH